MILGRNILFVLVESLVIYDSNSVYNPEKNLRLSNLDNTLFNISRRFNNGTLPSLGDIQFCNCTLKT